MTHPLPTDTSVPSRRYRTWLLVLLMATYACAWVDRIIIAVIGPRIVADLGLSDLEFGLLGGLAFAVLFSTFGIPFARLAERKNRVTLTAISIAAWSGMTMLCGVARSYWQLLAFRVGVGLGEAGAVPAAHSLLSDHFPPRERASALAVYSIGAPAGVIVGSVAGGWLAETFGWRMALVAVGAPGFVIAWLVRQTLCEPARGRFDPPAASSAPSLGVTVRRLLASPTFRHLAIGATIATTAASGINLFAPSYFVRGFGLSLTDAGRWFGLVVGVSGVVGILAGGFGADLGARRDLRWYAWAPAIGVALACPLYIAAFSQATIAPTMTLLFVGALSLTVYFAPTFAVTQNLVESRMRASASALLLVATNVVGQGLGPVFMGFVSDRVARGSFTGGDYESVCLAGSVPAALATACAQASVRGLQRSIVLTACLFAWGAVHYALAARTVKRDIAAVMS